MSDMAKPYIITIKVRGVTKEQQLQLDKILFGSSTLLKKVYINTFETSFRCCQSELDRISELIWKTLGSFHLITIKETYKKYTQTFTVHASAYDAIMNANKYFQTFSLTV
jgi:hypothetical protein